MNVKSILSLGLSIGLIGGALFTSSPSQKVEAAEKIGKCTITITTNNTIDNPVNATGPCKGFIKGWYVKSSNVYVIDGSVTTEVYNGQKLSFGLPPTAGKYNGYELTVKTVKKSSSSKSDSSKTTNSTKKDSSKSNTSTKKNTSKNNSTTKKKTTKTTTKSKKVKPKSNSTSKSSSSKSSSKNSKSSKVNVVKKSKKKSSNLDASKEYTKEYTLDELKKKHAQVSYDDGKYYAKVGNVKQEITKQQANDLGNKDNGDDKTVTKNDNNNGIQNVPTNKKDIALDKNNDKKDDSNMTSTILIGAIIIAVVTLICLYLFNHKTRQAINNMLSKVKRKK